MIIENLRRLREKNELKQEYIAKKLGVTKSQYSRIENGETTLSLEKALILADLYDISLDELLNRNEKILLTKDEYEILIEAANILIKLKDRIRKKDTVKMK